jgi:hypothetical protein
MRHIKTPKRAKRVEFEILRLFAKVQERQLFAQHRHHDFWQRRFKDYNSGFNGIHLAALSR